MHKLYKSFPSQSVFQVTEIYQLVNLTLKFNRNQLNLSNSGVGDEHGDRGMLRVDGGARSREPTQGSLEREVGVLETTGGNNINGCFRMVARAVRGGGAGGGHPSDR